MMNYVLSLPPQWVRRFSTLAEQTGVMEHPLKGLDDRLLPSLRQLLNQVDLGVPLVGIRQEEIDVLGPEGIKLHPKMTLVEQEPSAANELNAFVPESVPLKHLQDAADQVHHASSFRFGNSRSAASACLSSLKSCRRSWTALSSSRGRFRPR